MLGQIWFWLTHHHEWKILRAGRWGDTYKGKVLETGNYYDLQCKGCGKVRTSKV